LRQLTCSNLHAAIDRYPFPGVPWQEEQTQKAARKAAKKKKHQVFFSFVDRSLNCLLTRCFSELLSPCSSSLPFGFPSDSGSDISLKSYFRLTDFRPSIVN
jgi:hypothetical protein